MFVSDCTLWNSSDIILVRMVWCQVMVGKHWLRMGRVVGDSGIRMRKVVGNSCMSKGVECFRAMRMMMRFRMMRTKSMGSLG